MYPCIKINLEHLGENVRVVTKLCHNYGIEVTGVTKMFRADPRIASVYLENGIKRLGDARLENLKKLVGLKAEKWLIRPPMLDEIEELVRYSDVSLNSEVEVIRAIDREADRQKRVHQIILMADMGDIREGFTDYNELLDTAVEMTKMNHVKLYGIGTNLTCFSFVQPDREKMELLIELAKKAEYLTGQMVPIISCGNSATLDLMLNDAMPKGANNLRLGEALLFGRERAKYCFIPGTYNDVFILECEIIELKEKPSLPWGIIGTDSYGNRPEFVDRGKKRKKAICALGKQDFDPETSVPVDPGVLILGASSDHLMLDVTDSEKHYSVGDKIELRLGYFSAMRVFTSDYVKKVYC